MTRLNRFIFVLPFLAFIHSMMIDFNSTYEMIILYSFRALMFFGVVAYLIVGNLNNRKNLLRLDCVFLFLLWVVLVNKIVIGDSFGPFLSGKILLGMAALFCLYVLNEKWKELIEYSRMEKVEKETQDWKNMIDESEGN